VLTGDTAPSPLVVQAAHGADLLVHEASFLADEAERARETMHSTAAQAAEVARLAQVRLLALTHVSPRYFGPELAAEACAVFPETVVPRDFDLIEVPFPERAAPLLVKSGARPPRREAEVPMIEEQ
jgi:ribonuclease Z